MINYFATPKAFLLLLIIPVFILWEIIKKKPTINYPELPNTTHPTEAGRMPERMMRLFSRVTAIEYILITLKSLALILFILALARPQHVNQQREIYRNGVDIVLALDASGSMAAEDLKGNRLISAKKIIENFIIKRENDRLGFVVFGERAITKAPLTFDHEMLINIVDKIKLGEAGDSTAIGEAIVNCLNRLRSSQAKSKLIILVTDGENNNGEISPLEAAGLAKELGVKIYTIGIGTEAGVPFPFVDPQYGKQYARYPDGSYVLTKLHADDLIKIADLTNARYYQAKSTSELQAIFTQIDTLEKIKLKTTSHFEHEDRFEMFIVMGILILLIELIVSKTILRVLP